MKAKLKELGVMIGCSYTCISIGGAIANIIAGTETNNENVLIMFWLVTIACSVLSLYKFFSNFSPLLIIIIQYIITIVLVMGSAMVINIFSPISPGGFKSYFLSFTIPYIILVSVFYIDIFRSTKKQNDILKEIQQYNVENM